MRVPELESRGVALRDDGFRPQSHECMGGGRVNKVEGTILTSVQVSIAVLSTEQDYIEQ